MVKNLNRLHSCCARKNARVQRSIAAARAFVHYVLLSNTLEWADAAVRAACNARLIRNAIHVGIELALMR